jgi:hypothetical protein
LELSFEVGKSLVAERGMPTLAVVVGNVVGKFEAGYLLAGKATAVEQFGLEPAPEGLGQGVS